MIWSFQPFYNRPCNRGRTPHKKSKIFQQYLGKRDYYERRVSAEDEITSLIMSPLAFMAPEAIAAFWTLIIENECKDPDFPAGPIDNAKMEFWPRRSVEPDLFVELAWESGERRWILVEFKWRASLSGEDQLHRQWAEFLTEDERKNAYHIFIAPDVRGAQNLLPPEEIKQWNGRLLLCPWSRVVAILKHTEKPQMKFLKTWALEVESLLSLLHIRLFRGFKNIAIPQQGSFNLPIFWRSVADYGQIAASIS